MQLRLGLGQVERQAGDVAAVCRRRQVDRGADVVGRLRQVRALDDDLTGAAADRRVRRTRAGSRLRGRAGRGRARVEVKAPREIELEARQLPGGRAAHRRTSYSAKRSPGRRAGSRSSGPGSPAASAAGACLPELNAPTSAAIPIAIAASTSSGPSSRSRRAWAPREVRQRQADPAMGSVTPPGSASRRAVAVGAGARGRARARDAGRACRWPVARAATAWAAPGLGARRPVVDPGRVAGSARGRPAVRARRGAPAVGSTGSDSVRRRAGAASAPRPARTIGARPPSPRDLGIVAVVTADAARGAAAVAGCQPVGACRAGASRLGRRTSMVATWTAGRSMAGGRRDGRGRRTAGTRTGATGRPGRRTGGRRRWAAGAVARPGRRRPGDRAGGGCAGGAVRHRGAGARRRGRCAGWSPAAAGRVGARLPRRGVRGSGLSVRGCCGRASGAAAAWSRRGARPVHAVAGGDSRGCARAGAPSGDTAIDRERRRITGCSPGGSGGVAGSGRGASGSGRSTSVQTSPSAQVVAPRSA